MTDFLCKVATAAGEVRTLRRSAASEAVLARDLNHEGYLILKIGSAPRTAVASNRLKPKSILRFTEILQTLTSNGLSIKDAIVMARPLGGKELQSVFALLDEAIRKGKSLHQALVDGPSGFSPLYFGLIKIGEQTGDLSQILPRLVDYLKARQALREKVISAVTYPAFVLVLALVGIVLLAVFVLPNLTGSISGVNPQLAREYDRNVAAFQLGSTLLLGFLALLAILVLVVRFSSRFSSRVALSVDDLILSIPVVGSLAWQSFCLNVSFSLEVLLASGFSLEVALGECDTLITNRSILASWQRAREHVEKGVPLSQALRRESRFPEVFLGWIEVGEAAHDLKRTFRHLRQFYQNESELLAARFATLAEPSLIVLVGFLVIVLVLTFVTPIFTMLGGIVQ